MRHDLEAALPADLKGSADLVVEQKRMGVEVPSRAHDAAREVKLDMVDAVFDLLADGFHPAIGAVDLQRMTRGQEMSARSGEEITAGEQPRADMLSGVEGPLPCDVHEVMGAGAAQSDNAGFGKRGGKPVAEQGNLIGERHLVERQVIGMDVHVPEARHQIPAVEIDHLRVAGVARLSGWQDGADAAILDQHGSIRPYLGLDAVDQVRMRKDCLHGGLLGLKSEILGSRAAHDRAADSVLRASLFTAAVDRRSSGPDSEVRSTRRRREMDSNLRYRERCRRSGRLGVSIMSTFMSREISKRRQEAAYLSSHTSSRSIAVEDASSYDRQSLDIGLPADAAGLLRRRRPASRHRNQ